MELTDFVELAKAYRNLTEGQRNALDDLLDDTSRVHEWNPRVVGDLKQDFLDRRGAEHIEGAEELATVIEDYLDSQ